MGGLANKLRDPNHQVTISTEDYFEEWRMLERRDHKGRTTVECGESDEEVNLIAPIDNVST